MAKPGTEWKCGKGFAGSKLLKLDDGDSGINFVFSKAYLERLTVHVEITRRALFLQRQFLFHPAMGFRRQSLSNKAFFDHSDILNGVSMK